MSASSSKPQPPPHLHVDTSATATATTANGSATASPGPGSAFSSSQSHHRSCAACRFCRRRCSPDCPLAPYFPADQPRRFLNARRLFCVSNIEKTLRRAGPVDGPATMRALIYESEARAADPVAGCVRTIDELERQLRDSEMELQFVRQQIAVCRALRFLNNGAGAGDDGGMPMQQYGGSTDVVDGSVNDGSPCPQVLPVTIQHHGPAATAAGDDVLPPQQKKLATPVLEEEQQVTAGSPCHLDLWS